LVDLPRFELRS